MSQNAKYPARKQKVKRDRKELIALPLAGASWQGRYSGLATFAQFAGLLQRY